MIKHITINDLPFYTKKALNKISICSTYDTEYQYMLDRILEGQAFTVVQLIHFFTFNGRIDNLIRKDLLPFMLAD